MTLMVVKQTEPGLWTVGHYDGDNKWHPFTDHKSVDAARQELHYLNGGQS
jgi:hypothetical protein